MHTGTRVPVHAIVPRLEEGDQFTQYAYPVGTYPGLQTVTIVSEQIRVLRVQLYDTTVCIFYTCTGVLA